MTNGPLWQPVAGAQRCADLAVGEMDDAALEKPDPHALLRRFRRDSRRLVLMIQRCPGYLLNLPRVRGDAKQTTILVHEPDVLAVLHHAASGSARKTRDGNKMVVVEIADS